MECYKTQLIYIDKNDDFLLEFITKLKWYKSGPFLFLEREMIQTLSSIFISNQLNYFQIKRIFIFGKEDDTDPPFHLLFLPSSLSFSNLFQALLN